MRIKRRQILMTAAVTTVAATLAACGSSQHAANLSSTTGGTSTGASGTATTSASASASSASSPSTASSSSVAPGALPDLTLPADVTLQFNLPKTGDPLKDAALQGLVQAEKAKYKATETGLTTGPLVDDFFINNGAISVRSYLVTEQQGNITVTGTNVYYDWKFTQATADNKAFQITYCEDQNKFFDKDRKTGQAKPQQSGLAQILSFKINMVIDKDGRWKTGYYSWKAGDATCQAAEGH